MSLEKLATGIKALQNYNSVARVYAMIEPHGLLVFASTNAKCFYAPFGLLSEEEQKQVQEDIVKSENICPICSGLGEYDKAEVYGSETPVFESCDNCNGKGYIS